MRVTLTERFVKTAEAGERTSPIFMDDAVIGFGVQVRRNGRKTFTFDYTFEARRRRATIGDFPVWSVAAAREEAKRLKREVDAGRDPLAVRDARMEAPTIRDLVTRYIAEHASRLVPEARRTQISMLETHVLLAWGDRKVTDIRTGDVDALLADIARGRARQHKKKTRHRRVKPLAPAKPTPVQANRIGAVIRKMFNLAIRWDLCTDNPAKAFLRNPEQPRERFLNASEIDRLTEILDRHPNRRGATIIRLLMLTGARRGEVLNARWEQFDLDARVWTKPAAATKQKRLHRVPISGATVQLLRSIRSTVPADCPWLFPGDVAGKPVQEIKRFWADIRARADLPGVRIHDLRHTFASLLVSGGMTLPMIGKLLGHTQVQTTQRYAHLFDDPLRAGLERVGEVVGVKPKLVQSEAMA
ncbi:XerC Integrase [Rhabdaerophilaceae bacterium]